MIAEFSAAMAAIKETATLARVVSDAKTEAEITAAVGEMVSKLTSVQRECITLVELVRTYQEETVALKAIIADFEDFKAKSEGYVLNELPSGTIVYTKKHVVNTGEILVNICPSCFLEKKVSVLQPCASSGGFYQIFCPSCSTTYRSEKMPPRQPRVVKADLFS